MRIVSVAICLVVIGSQAFFLTPNAFCEGLDYQLSGVLYEQPTVFDIEDDNLLNPDNDILDLSGWSNRLYGRISFDLHYKDLKFITQTRPTSFQEEDSEDGSFIVDDAYLDIAFGEQNFFFIGKRNVRDLVAYGANPIDFLGEDKELDYTKREEERWVERKGNYLVGVETFLHNITLSAIYAPQMYDWRQDEPDRILLKGNLFLESLNTDMSLQLYSADVPGIGFTVSSTVSDNLVLHTECAFRKGSYDKKKISVVSEGSDTAPREFEIADLDDESKIYPNIVVGGSYTFDDGTNLICEYIYNSDGYDSGDWNDFEEYVRYNHDAYVNNTFSDYALGNLASANDRLVNIRKMRQNYIFLRLSNSTLIEDIDAQLVFILNADDRSFLTFPTIDYKMGTNMVLGLSATIFSGESDSEFGMMWWDSQTSLLLKYYF